MGRQEVAWFQRSPAKEATRIDSNLPATQCASCNADHSPSACFYSPDGRTSTYGVSSRRPRQRTAAHVDVERRCDVRRELVDVHFICGATTVASIRHSSTSSGGGTRQPIDVAFVLIAATTATADATIPARRRQCLFGRTTCGDTSNGATETAATPCPELEFELGRSEEKVDVDATTAVIVIIVFVGQLFVVCCCTRRSASNRSCAASVLDRKSVV